MTKTIDYYDSQASDYDGFIRKLVPGYDFFMTITPVLVGSPKTVLDIGCGTGNTAAAITKIHKDAEITCVEPSTEMLSIAKSRLDAEYIQSSIESFQPDITYDAITSTLVMHNIQTREEKQSVYNTIYKSLNSPGVYITADIINGENDITQNLYMTMWRSFMLNNLSQEEVDGKWLPLHKEKDKPLKISEQMVMLYDAGFRSIDIINKNINYVMMACYK